MGPACRYTSQQRPKGRKITSLITFETPCIAAADGVTRPSANRWPLQPHDRG
jgi:hypothetical protein